MRYVDLTIERRDFPCLLTYYIWWQDPVESLARPERLVAQIVDIGDWDDECDLENVFGDEVVRKVLTHAEPGWFRPKSWPFWIYLLKLIPLDAQLLAGGVAG